MSKRSGLCKDGRSNRRGELLRLFFCRKLVVGNWGSDSKLDVHVVNLIAVYTVLYLIRKDQIWRPALCIQLDDGCESWIVEVDLSSAVGHDLPMCSTSQSEIRNIP